MPAESKHLEKIVSKHNRLCNAQVVFLDIEKYSKRRPIMQIKVIDEFTQCLKRAIFNTSQSFTEHASKSGIDFSSDIILLPTGDGAAVIFTFDGLHDIHLLFAKSILKEAHSINKKLSCKKFQDNGWCDCHTNFNLRIGVSEGRVIVYKDINNNFNIAGNTINYASRVMGLADANQIIFTQEAYDKIIEMAEDDYLIDHFAVYDDIQIKHGVEIDVYHFFDNDIEYINSTPPKKLSMQKSMQQSVTTLKGAGLGFPKFEKLNLSEEKLFDLVTALSSAITTALEVAFQKEKTINQDNS